MNFFRRHLRRMLLILLLTALGAGLCAFLYPAESVAVAKQLASFPDSDTHSHRLRPLILGSLCFLPALAALIYSFGGTLDRYITRQFLGIFGICITALFSIWLLFDLSDNYNDFQNAKSMLPALGKFYGIRSPAILLQLLPYSLLLALLYSLGKLSTHREIMAMIQSGRGIIRITFPLVIAGALCSLITMGLNYHWAPVADGRQDEILAEASGQQATEAVKVLYRNPDSQRLWMIGTFPPDYEKGAPLMDVEITTTDTENHLTSRLAASHARWIPATRQWNFDNAVTARFTPDNPPVFTKSDGPLVIDGWPETPWLLIKPGLSPAYMGIPGLSTWLQSHRIHQLSADASPYRTQWHYRWALPLICLITVILATPLAIHFSRRGSGGGIFLAVVLSATMMLFTSIILALGEAGIIRPALAAWLPNITFGLIGLYLFHRRISGRPIYQTLRRIIPGDS